MNIDVASHIRLVPLFQEKEIERCFPLFERVAANSPKRSWTLFLQSLLVGRAHEAYSNYDLVKKAILKAYELVPSWGLLSVFHELYEARWANLC